MRKVAFIVVIISLAIAGASATYFLKKGSSFGIDQRIPAAIELVSFRGENPPFDFTFEYPEAWRVSETKLSEDSHMVQVFGPQDPVTQVVPGIFATVKATSDQELSPVIAEAILKKEQQFKRFLS